MSEITNMTDLMGEIERLRKQLAQVTEERDTIQAVVSSLSMNDKVSYRSWREEAERLSDMEVARRKQCEALQQQLATARQAVWLEAAKELEHRYNRTWDCSVFIEEFMAWCRQQAEAVKP